MVNNNHFPDVVAPEKKNLTTEEKFFGPADKVQNPFASFSKSVLNTLFVKPAQFIHDNVVEAVRPAPEDRPSWYHRRFRRVPTIDECYYSDHACQ